MDTKELNSRIDALGRANLKVESDIHELGMACLEHTEKHGDTMPMNRLVNVLRRTQYQAFLEWAMAFGKFVKNTDKVTKASQPLVYAKGKATDLEAAAGAPWFTFAPDRDPAMTRAFDFQAAVMNLLKRAASKGVEHDKLVAVAALADIAPEKVPATVTVPAVGEALV